MKIVLIASAIVLFFSILFILWDKTLSAREERNFLMVSWVAGVMCFLSAIAEVAGVSLLGLD